MSIYRIPNRYPIFHIDITIDISLMSDLPYRSPISISHIDLPIISCHSGPGTRGGGEGPGGGGGVGAPGGGERLRGGGCPLVPSLFTRGPRRKPGASSYTVTRLSLSHCLLIVYRCTRTHSPHPPPRPGRSFPSLFAPGTRVEHDGG